MIELTVLCLTYNHEKFIEDALQGFVRQITTFKFKVVIYDDCSNDRTRSIIKKYKETYPNLFHCILSDYNRFSKGEDAFRDCLVPEIEGQFVAICEGDDYWIDNFKLQKQYDFLQKHLDYNICFHPVRVVSENNEGKSTTFPDAKTRFYKSTLDLKHLLKRNFIQTNSVVYRWQALLEDFPKKQVLPADWLWHILNAKNGKIGYLPEIMAVYRRHDHGIWYEYGKNERFYLRFGLQIARFYDFISKTYKVRKSKILRSILIKTMLASVKNNNTTLLKEINDEFPYYYKAVYYQVPRKMRARIYKTDDISIKEKVEILFINIYLFLR